MTTQIAHIRSLLDIFEDKDTDVFRNVPGGSQLLAKLRKARIIDHTTDLQKVPNNNYTVGYDRYKIVIGQKGCATITGNSPTYGGYKISVYYNDYGVLKTNQIDSVEQMKDLIGPVVQIYQIPTGRKSEDNPLTQRLSRKAVSYQQDLELKQQATTILYNKLMPLLEPIINSSFHKLKNSIKYAIDNKDFDGATMLVARAIRIKDIQVELQKEDYDLRTSGRLRSLFNIILTDVYKESAGKTTNPIEYNNWELEAVKGSKSIIRQIINGFKRFVTGEKFDTNLKSLFEDKSVKSQSRNILQPVVGGEVLFKELMRTGAIDRNDKFTEADFDEIFEDVWHFDVVFLITGMDGCAAIVIDGFDEETQWDPANQYIVMYATSDNAPLRVEYSSEGHYGGTLSNANVYTFIEQTIGPIEDTYICENPSTSSAEVDEKRRVRRGKPKDRSEYLNELYIKVRPILKRNLLKSLDGISARAKKFVDSEHFEEVNNILTGCRRILYWVQQVEMVKTFSDSLTRPFNLALRDYFEENGINIESYSVNEEKHLQKIIANRSQFNAFVDNLRDVFFRYKDWQ